MQERYINSKTALLAWELEPIGDWRKVSTDTGIDIHATMQSIALHRSKEKAI